MILKALYDYYHRSKDLVAPMGLEYKVISFVIVIDYDGNLCRIEDDPIEKLVVKSNNRTGTKSKPNHLWDNFSYVLGISDANLKEAVTADKEAKHKMELERNNRNHLAFLKYVNDLNSQHPNDKDLKAVVNFYDKNKNLLALLQKADIWINIKRNLNKNVSFRIQGETQIIAEKETVLTYIDDNETDSSRNSVCVVTGEKCHPIKTFTKIPFGKFSDTKLVSFQKNSGYDSYRKEQGDNAPMSKYAEFAVSTALKKLIGYNSKNKYIIGSRTFAFWASKDTEINKQLEELTFSILQGEKDDDPNRRLDIIKKTFQSIYNGKKPIQTDDRFYILGMFAANKARIAVSYWAEITVNEYARKILQHFGDMNITTNGSDGFRYCSLYAMLRSVCLNGNIDKNCPNNLPDAVVKSIFQGLPYPSSLFQACIRRIRAESNGKENEKGEKRNPVNITRAAIIKAYLNRLNDYNSNKKLDIMLDKENKNLGYLCGRLFAVLDKIQEDANGIHSIRERYMNSASATPATVFATIMNLSIHHMEKLNEGTQIFYEKLKQEIISKLEANGFPTHLDLQDQGRFFVGYYHQRQDFFKGKGNDNTEE